MSTDKLLLDRNGPVLTLTLNRPEKRNALDGETVRELTAALREAGGDPVTRVVSLRGAGPDFCAGADLAELGRIATLSAEENLEDARALGRLFTTIRALPKPVVAVVHGRALAGGCGLATACDVVLARADAEFGYPEIHLGFVPAMVMAILRRKVTEMRAFDLVVGGRRIDAREAHRIGLVTRVIDAGDFEEECGRWLSELAARPAKAVALTKALLYELGELGFEAGVERGAQVNVEARMTDECREGVRRFLDRSG